MNGPDENRKAIHFTTRVNRTTLLATLAGFLILAVSIGFPLAFTPKEELNFHWLMAIPGAIFLFMTWVILRSLTKFLIHFKIGVEGLKITLPPFDSTFITWSDLERVVLISAEGSQQLFEAAIRDQESFQQDGDMIGYIKTIKMNAPAYKYLSIAPSATVAHTGRKMTDLEVVADEKMVYLKVKGDRELFIAPDRPDAFVATLLSFLPATSSQPIG